MPVNDGKPGGDGEEEGAAEAAERRRRAEEAPGDGGAVEPGRLRRGEEGDDRAQWDAAADEARRHRQRAARAQRRGEADERGADRPRAPRSAPRLCSGSCASSSDAVIALPSTTHGAAFSTSLRSSASAWAGRSPDCRRAAPSSGSAGCR